MKALLLKDWYQMTRYCRSYLLIIAVFFGVSLVSSDNLFFRFYPCALVGMIPATLLSYDERSGWERYAQTLPVSKDQLVGEKYLLGLLTILAVYLFTMVFNVVLDLKQGMFTVENLLVELQMFLAFALLAPAVSLPLMFKLGVEKGRIAYLVMIGVICGGGVMAATMLGGAVEISPYGLITGLCCGAVILYLLSWRLAVTLYRKREV